MVWLSFRSWAHPGHEDDMFWWLTWVIWCFLGGSEGKASACNAGDLGLISGSGRCLGEGNGNPLQYSCLENSIDGGAWWATVHWVSKNWTRLNDFTFIFFLGHMTSPGGWDGWGGKKKGSTALSEPHGLRLGRVMLPEWTLQATLCIPKGPNQPWMTNTGWYF